MLEEDKAQVREDLALDVGPVRVLDFKVKKLQGKNIRTTKVLWDGGMQAANWELKEHMKKLYPYMFPGKYNFLGRKFFWLGRM